MEWLDFTEKSSYNAAECAIHLNRYFTAKQYVAGKRVLDVACGEGYGSKLLKSWGAESVVGVDISESALQVANSKFAEEGITFLHHSAEELPFESNSFDVVVSFETIEHLEHPEKFLEEISRVVKFNGTVLISCPNDSYYEKNEQDYSNPFHKRQYTWFEFKEIAEKFLGAGEAWYFGFALRGVSTIPAEATREPETDGLPSSMTELLNYSTPEYAALLQAERYLNHWNAGYYLGVWGPESSKLGQGGVFYPDEIFTPVDDSMREEMLRWKKEYNQELADRNIEVEKLRQRYQESLAEREKKILELEQNLAQAKLEMEEKISVQAQKHGDLLQEKQNGIAELEKQAAKEAQRYENLLEEKQAEIIELEKQVAKGKTALHTSQVERERTSNLLKVAETEKQYLWNRIRGFETAIRQRDERIFEQDEILRSKAVKLVFLFWKIRNKISKIFGRK